ncbi:MAG: FlgD immunoglobulin-like domain containing protein [bacterium]
MKHRCLLSIGLAGLFVVVFEAGSASADYQLVSYTPTGFTGFQSNLLGDIDADGRLEMAGINGAIVTIYDAMTGIPEFSTSVPEGVVTGTMFHDLDGDGSPELLVASQQPGLGVIDFIGAVTSVDHEPAFSSGKSLAAPRPNPFNPSTRIEFTLDVPGRVELSVYDASGRLIRTLIDEPSDPGRYEISWDGQDDSGRALASGTYFYQLRVNGQSVGSQKAVILR